MPAKNDIENLTKSEYINHILKYYIVPYFVFFLIVFFLFKDNIELGMQFDEVIRINNLIPFINPGAEPYNQSIFGISVFGFSIPLIYKFYLSTAMLIPYLPLYFFKTNLLWGLRFLYGFYFFLSISVFFFIMSRKFSYTISFLSSVLIITSPLFYPEALIGFAHCIHLIFLSSAIYCFYLFFEKNRGSIYLFLGVFLLCFEANIEAYFLWVIAALIITSIMLYPNYWKILLGSVKNYIIVILAIILGWINFFIYNILSPFSTIRPFYLKIFDPMTYNEQPVDYKQATPLLTDVSNKINNIFPSFFEGYSYIYLLIIIALIIVNILLIFKFIRTHQFSTYKHYFYSFICFCLIFFLILVSPNTTRAGHYVYLIPFFEISIVSLFLLGEKFYNEKFFSQLLAVVLIGLILLNFITTGISIVKMKETGGRKHFSPAIFELNNYIRDESLQSQDIIFLEWGMYTQLYFLNQGEFKINSLVFQLYDLKNYEERKTAFIKYFKMQSNDGRSNKFYFPLYYYGFDKRNDAIFTDFDRFVTENNGTLNKIKTFYETQGDEVISVYELQNTSQFLDSVNKFTE
jgi:hypothetical protein